MKVAKTSELPEGGQHIVETPEGKTIALFHREGKMFAIDNTCLHKGGPLGEGEVQGETVSCPWHGWQYNIRTGECLTKPGEKVGCYTVRVEGDDIFLDHP